MPQKRELTWQTGTAGRRGRWRKKYGGKVYYFSMGRCKSDQEGYQQAAEAWTAKKKELDEKEHQPPKPHRAEYERAIDDWSIAQHWAREKGDTEFVGLAQRRIDSLSRRLQTNAPPALEHYDHLHNQRTLPRELIAPVVRAFEESVPALDESALAEMPMGTMIVPPPAMINELDGSPGRVFAALWKDRLATERNRRAPNSETLAKSIEAFLNVKRVKVAARKLSAGRCDNLRGYLHSFRDWLGAAVAPTSITGQTLEDYHTELLAKVVEGSCSNDYAKDRLDAVKTFVRWLWRTHRISDLPRNLVDCKDLRITKEGKLPATFIVDEVKKLLAAASDRTKLYLLLMLNCAMTQKDVSDLAQDEVNWNVGEITRKRSKTAKHDNVPIVRYRLWPETFRLLKQERSTDPHVVLLNSQGGRLKTEEFRGGKLRKTDNVVSAYRRLCTVVKIKKPIKLLRKTAVSVLASNGRFYGLREVFLGLAPDKIADRHYVETPQELLNEAVAWLGQQFGVEQATVDPC